MINKLFESLIDAAKPILYIPLARDRGEDNYDSCKTWLTSELKDIKHGEIVIEDMDKQARGLKG